MNERKSVTHNGISGQSDIDSDDWTLKTLRDGAPWNRMAAGALALIERLQARAAEAEKDAIERAAKVCEERADRSKRFGNNALLMSFALAEDAEALACAGAIRALSPPKQQHVHSAGASDVRKEAPVTTDAAARSDMTTPRTNTVMQRAHGKISSARADDFEDLARELECELMCLVHMLIHAGNWIAGAQHGDNCYLTDEYPGNQCWCGKESTLGGIADMLNSPDAAAVSDAAESLSTTEAPAQWPVGRGSPPKGEAK